MSVEESCKQVMKSVISDKLYKNFSAKERMNLMIASLIREDEEEIQRLKNTCPVYRYQIMDADYFFGMNHLVEIGREIAILCFHYYSKYLAAMDASVSYYFRKSAMEQDFEKSYGIKNSNKMTFSEMKKKLKRQKEYQEAEDKYKNDHHRYQSCLLSIYEAFSDFCMNQGLNFDHVSVWLIPVEIRKFVGKINQDIIQVDLELKKEILILLESNV
jgi:hypothetical protein